jgi:hypothetical protein
MHPARRFAILGVFLSAEREGWNGSGQTMY